METNEPNTAPDLRAILRRHWGYPAFRPLQEDIIRSVLSGRDTLALMPTGGGKSITYQVAGLALGGLTLVVTPLVALMKDQVEDLRRRGLSAEALHLGMDRERLESVANKCVHAGVAFLYVSPERLASARFRAKLRQMPVRLIAVDEAHCISQWGYDFRPSYLRIAEIRDYFPSAPVLALTATATPDVAADIQRRLRFPAPNVLAKSFRRHNLSYVVRDTPDRAGETVRVLTRVKAPAIVYVRRRERAEELARTLNENGVLADYYHAGLSSSARARRQEAWKSGAVPVVVATNAFGMGIDKPDVRVVVHFDIPDSPEAYFQEAGRAGRDGRRAYAVLLCNADSVAALKRRVANEFPAKAEVLRVYAALADHFQLGEGEGEGLSFEFDAARFCRDFRLDPFKTAAAIDILSVGGYLELLEDAGARSRVTFTVRRDDLYGRDTGTPLQERLLVLLMRRCPGIFVQDAFVDEERLADDLGVGRHELYEALLGLARLRVIRYVPADGRPRVRYLRPRLPLSYIDLAPAVYDDRREAFLRKNKAMAAYIEDPGPCRQLALMAYFGQKETEPCGVCDLCLARKKALRAAAPADARPLLLRLLAGGPPAPDAPAARASPPRDAVAAAARALLDEGAAVLLPDGRLTLSPDD